MTYMYMTHTNTHIRQTWLYIFAVEHTHIRHVYIFSSRTEEAEKSQDQGLSGEPG